MMQISLKKLILNFTFDAGTSRGVLKTKNTWFIRLQNKEGVIGIGEAGPLPKLSIDDQENFEEFIKEKSNDISLINSLHDIYEIVPSTLPSLIFALETAYLDLMNGGKKCIYNTKFYSAQQGIPINGLVWMNTASHMYQQAFEKINSGFNCLKFKVGALEFEEEVELLRNIRKNFPSIEIRLDANGAWSYEEALEKLKILSQFNIHSIEQPIKAGLTESMAKLCRLKIIDIALDEELIGIHIYKSELLTQIKPQYIILKPTLLGGFLQCDEWIDLAQKHSIGWWNTSALESNIGLNAISQYSHYKDPHKMHGLGTGKLFDNNINSPLEVLNGEIKYVKDASWEEIIF